MISFEIAANKPTDLSPCRDLLCLSERLQGTPARLEDKLRRLGPHSFTFCLDGRKSIQQLIGEMLLFELRWNQELNFLGIFNSLATIRTKTQHFNAKSMVVLLRDVRDLRKHTITNLESLKTQGIQSSAVVSKLQELAENDDNFLVDISKLCSDLLVSNHLMAVESDLE